MPEWLLILKGHEFDLEDLPSVLNNPELAVIKRDNKYLLRSSDFQAFTSADEVRERGLVLLDLLNGAAKLYFDSYREIAEDGVAQIDDDGKLHRTFFVSVVEEVRAKDRVSVVSILSDGSRVPVQLPSQDPKIRHWIKLARQHKHVADALHFFRENNWFSLYKVFEIIRDDVGNKQSITSKGWVSSSELNRFTQTAQSRATLGDFARHASSNYVPPDNPMSLQEAQSLLKQLLSGWLNSKT